jgi:hypothetical protein
MSQIYRSFWVRRVPMIERQGGVNRAVQNGPKRAASFVIML